MRGREGERERAFSLLAFLVSLPPPSDFLFRFPSRERFLLVLERERERVIVRGSERKREDDCSSLFFSLFFAEEVWSATSTSRRRRNEKKKIVRLKKNAFAGTEPALVFFYSLHSGRGESVFQVPGWRKRGLAHGTRALCCARIRRKHRERWGGPAGGIGFFFFLLLH